MQLILDERINQIDQLYVQIEKLIADYERFGRAQQKEALQVCIADILALKTACQQADMGMDEMLDNLLNVIESSETIQNYAEVMGLLRLMQDNVKKIYVACMHDEASYRHVKLENYFGTDYEKKALIIYIVYPFLFPDAPLGHTNQQEVKVMAELLHQRGYQVDIVNTRYMDELSAEAYDFMIGSGAFFESLCGKQKEGASFVYYLTESSPYHWNVAELQRLENFYQRNHCRLPFERLANTRLDLRALSQADAAICIGNGWTVSTYEGMFKKIYPLDVSGFGLNMEPEFGADAAEMRKHFMWYGGAGAVHKGLDLCIEAFRKLPELTLHIVGEPGAKFYDFYRKDIEEAENIYYYGFLNKDSDEFLQACKTCGYCVCPSCGEGQSTAMLTSMFAGMIPVCTVQTGIDLEKCGGIWIEDVSVDALAGLLKKSSELSESEVNERRKAAWEYVCSEHTLDNYRKNMEQILDDILA